MISCSDYDYIEIVCMYRYPVKLTLKTGDFICGTAVDTKRNADKEECIELLVDDQKELVVLDSLKSLEVQIENPHFNLVQFIS